jgi:hypothetical protein
MDLFNREELNALATRRGDLCVSLYLPTERVEAEQAQNPIRLKNLLKQTRATLRERGMRDREIDALLKPAIDRVEDAPFWISQSDGLAMFISNEEFRYWRLPLRFESICYVGSRFHLKPLFPMMAANNRFYVLALAKNSVRLFQGTHFSMSEVESSEIPASITDALPFEELEKQLQHHAGGRIGRDRSDMIFHGQGGGGSDDIKSKPQDVLRRFFREIDNGLSETLQGETAPLVLAGVEHYLPIYRSTNTYGNLISSQIVGGNVEHTHRQDLHRRAWEIVETLFLKDQEASISGFRDAEGGANGALTSTELEDIIPAAVYGRVDTLFVPIGAHLWGRYDEESQTVTLHESYENGDDDLLDFAAVHTYLNSGAVHALRPENMPVGGSLAATFRYPMQEFASTN